MGSNLIRLQIPKTPQAFFNKYPIKQRNLIVLLSKLFMTEDQEGQSDQISVLCKYIRQIIITRPRNVKEANNLFVFYWDEGCLVYWQGQLLNKVRWTHMQNVIRPVIPRESCFCYCCFGVLRPFDTFEVIMGAVSYYNHIVPGQSPRLSAYSFASTRS